MAAMQMPDDCSRRYLSFTRSHECAVRASSRERPTGADSHFDAPPSGSRALPLLEQWIDERGGCGAAEPGSDKEQGQRQQDGDQPPGFVLSEKEDELGYETQLLLIGRLFQCLSSLVLGLWLACEGVWLLGVVWGRGGECHRCLCCCSRASRFGTSPVSSTLKTAENTLRRTFVVDASPNSLRPADRIPAAGGRQRSCGARCQWE